MQLIISNLFFGWALKHVTRTKSQFKAVLALNKYVLIEFAKHVSKEPQKSVEHKGLVI